MRVGVVGGGPVCLGSGLVEALVAPRWGVWLGWGSGAAAVMDWTARVLR